MTLPIRQTFDIIYVRYRITLRSPTSSTWSSVPVWKKPASANARGVCVRSDGQFLKDASLVTRDEWVGCLAPPLTTPNARQVLPAFRIRELWAAPDLKRTLLLKTQGSFLIVLNLYWIYVCSSRALNQAYEETHSQICLKSILIL